VNVKIVVMGVTVPMVDRVNHVAAETVSVKSNGKIKV